MSLTFAHKMVRSIHTWISLCHSRIRRHIWIYTTRFLKLSEPFQDAGNGFNKFGQRAPVHASCAKTLVPITIHNLNPIGWRVLWKIKSWRNKKKSGNYLGLPSGIPNEVRAVFRDMICAWQHKWRKSQQCFLASSHPWRGLSARLILAMDDVCSVLASLVFSWHLFSVVFIKTYTN